MVSRRLLRALPWSFDGILICPRWQALKLRVPLVIRAVHVPVRIAAPAAEAIRIACKPDIVGKSGIAMPTSDAVRHAARPIATNCLCHAESEQAHTAGVLDARLERNSIARPPETKAVTN